MLKCNVSVNAIFYARAVFRKQKTVLMDLCYQSFSIDKKNLIMVCGSFV